MSWYDPIIWPLKFEFGRLFGKSKKEQRYEEIINKFLTSNCETRQKLKKDHPEIFGNYKW